mmetsp:Transcript_24245/g.69727  ORF Transcript_24245/g.69727 Transcript_24245/m.69727 type:complete len:151 (+) Transcript_24245:879-1331(+)
MEAGAAAAPVGEVEAAAPPADAEGDVGGRPEAPAVAAGASLADVLTGAGVGDAAAAATAVGGTSPPSPLFLLPFLKKPMFVCLVALSCLSINQSVLSARRLFLCSNWSFQVAIGKIGKILRPQRCQGNHNGIERWGRAEGKVQSSATGSA